MPVLTIGVMTGNSLDAVDTVLTAFDNGSITDLATHSIAYPPELTQKFLGLRERVKECHGDTGCLKNNPFFDETATLYTKLVAQTVNSLCAKAGIDKKEIAAIGLHGQTCDHFPPSIAGDKEPYTLQIADASLLADETDIPVIYDFRSDDMMNGGEGAPLAPVHNRHLCVDLKRKGIFPVAFCNAGNTGNIAVVSENDAGRETVFGWDAGPFNHFADLLTRSKTGKPCDFNGEYGKRGIIVPEALSDLFETVALTGDSTNFYLKKPPKSSDPNRYELDVEAVCSRYGFENTLRTVEYLSAYGFFHTLGFITANIRMPNLFLLFGGGWKNPLIRRDFQNLLNGKGFVLKRHRPLFEKILSRFEKTPEVCFSDRFGYSGKYMEARIFADMAHCRITGEPFSFPETTGCRTPTVAGIYVLPETGKEYLLEKLFDRYQTAGLIANEWHEKYNRAAKGWQKRKS